MLSKFVDASGWTAEQWLAAIILAFIMVTVMVVGHRVLKILKHTINKATGKYTHKTQPTNREV